MDPVNQVVELPNRTLLVPDLVLCNINTGLPIDLGFESLGLMPK